MKSQMKTLQIYKIEKTNCQQTLKTKIISHKKFTNTRKRQRYE